MKRTLRHACVLATLIAAVVWLPKLAQALPFKALRARLAIMELELADAEAILAGEDDEPEIALERARLQIYRGDCDGALAILERPDLDEVDEHPLLLEVSKGCARGTAGTIILRDDARGVVVRFQDDADRSLFPIIVDTAVKARDMLTKELGTRLPDPVWIDLVRDQFTLAALSGLPERAAKTTGTVAVAKWGRVMMISPRAAPNGYPWLDTLTHEMTHLVLSQATRDRAPLWLQEGVAKRQEIRWRERTPFDGVPSSDAVAWYGIGKGLALPLDGLGPSIAMLPTPEQATVAFAEVNSFIEYWVRENGEDALPKLLEAIRDLGPAATVSEAIEKVSGKSLAKWDELWRAYLAGQHPTISDKLAPGGSVPEAADASRLRRLGQLLLGRGHAVEAHLELDAAHRLIPDDASIRCLYSDALARMGEEIQAAEMVGAPEEVIFPGGRWWSLHQHFQMGDALPHARRLALGHDPFDPPIPCHELGEGEWPANAIDAAVCQAAWQTPAGRNQPGPLR
jgi:hypothetical protein